MSSQPVLRADALRVETTRGDPIIEAFSLTLERGEVLAVVGESGSGKTTAALTLMGYARRGARIVEGSVVVSGNEMLGRAPREQRRLRGRLISYVPQDPATALNPARRIGDQVTRMLREHSPERVAEPAVKLALERVGLPTSREFLRRYPHQLSGGQQQRTAIAIALIAEPSVVVLDEPTTALDVVTQAQVLQELRRLRAELGLAMVYVSHDLAVVTSIADRIAVMYGGRLVEQGAVGDIVSRPRHPYTRGLLESVPDYAQPRRLRGIPGAAVGVTERPRGCVFAPRCPQAVERCTASEPAIEAPLPGHEVRCYEWRRTPPPVVMAADVAATPSEDRRPLLAVTELSATYRARAGFVTAVDRVSFELAAGETLALVGESGSGKTTIARCVAGLHAPANGVVRLNGTDLDALVRDRSHAHRQRIQMVFQNPYASLNPRHSIGDAVARTAQLLRRLSVRDSRAEARRVLELVRVPVGAFDALPSELSGGERQRVAIARAVIAQPELLVCDEITSALDVSVQAAVLDLLKEIQTELDLSLLFITHDLAVVASISNRVVVLEAGRVREQGDVGRVLSQPGDDYTRRLIAAVPQLAASQESRPQEGSPAARSTGTSASTLS